MDDAERVRPIEGASDLRGDAHGLLELDGAASVDSVLEGLALEVLHDDVRRAVRRLAVVEHLNDEARTQARGGLRLVVEPRAGLSGVRILAGDELHRDALAERQVVGQPDAAHRARADLPL